MTEIRNFGQLVREARDARGMSQRKLCELVDVAERTLRDIESGRSDPGLSLARRLARVLGISLDGLDPARSAE